MSKIKQKCDQLLASLTDHWSLQLSAISTLSPEQFIQAPAEGKWSVGQVMWHLYNAERGSLAYIKKKCQYPDQLQSADFAARKNAWMVKTYLKFPIPVKAPAAAGVPPEQVSLEEINKKWQRSRAALSDFINTTDPVILAKQVYKHPLAGRMDMAGALGFFDQHQKRHNKQILRTAKVVS